VALRCRDYNKNIVGYSAIQSYGPLMKSGKTWRKAIVIADWPHEGFWGSRDASSLI